MLFFICLGFFIFSKVKTEDCLLWNGGICLQCSGPGYDPSTNCSTCKINWNPLTLCDTCINQYDKLTDCLNCSNHYDPTSLCQICYTNWDMDRGCTYCISGYSESSNCLECKIGYDIVSDCTECLPNYDRNEDCSKCINYYTIESDCTECPAGYDEANDCLECSLINYNPDDGCISCINHYDIDTNCEYCEEHFDVQTFCVYCMAGYLYPINNCNQCEDNYEMDIYGNCALQIDTSDPNDTDYDSSDPSGVYFVLHFGQGFFAAKFDTCYENYFVGLQETENGVWNNYDLYIQDQGNEAQITFFKSGLDCSFLETAEDDLIFTTISYDGVNTIKSDGLPSGSGKMHQIGLKSRCTELSTGQGLYYFANDMCIVPKFFKASLWGNFEVVLAESSGTRVKPDGIERYVYPYHDGCTEQYFIEIGDCVCFSNDFGEWCIEKSDILVSTSSKTFSLCYLLVIFVFLIPFFVFENSIGVKKIVKNEKYVFGEVETTENSIHSQRGYLNDFIVVLKNPRVVFYEKNAKKVMERKKLVCEKVEEIGGNVMIYKGHEQDNKEQTGDKYLIVLAKIKLPCNILDRSHIKRFNFQIISLIDCGKDLSILVEQKNWENIFGVNLTDLNLQIESNNIMRNVSRKLVNKVFTIKIKLETKLEHNIYRILKVKGSTNFELLHSIINGAMGWYNYHLHSFSRFCQTEAQKNGISNTWSLFGNHSDSRQMFDDLFSDNYTPRDVASEYENSVDQVLVKGDKFVYTYDFGDDWIHFVEVLDVEDEDDDVIYPICVKGENACPPEDSGSVSCFFERIEKIEKGGDEDGYENWVRKQCERSLTNVACENETGKYDKSAFDIDVVNDYIISFQAN